MTTGRINQVAFLRDAAPRPRAAGAVGGRERPSFVASRFSWDRDVSPRPRRALGPRAPHAPAGHATGEGSVEHGGCYVVLLRPLEGAGWRLSTVRRRASLLRVGNTRTSLWGTIPPRATDADRLPAVRWTGTEPAGSDDPNTTHTPTRSCLPDASVASTPRSPWACEQMEAREAPVQHR